MNETAEMLEVRLRRLSAAARRSRETYLDDVRAFHAVVREAEAARKSVRWIAQRVGMSVAQTHRIMAGITGPDAA